jgi:hypothetical protein
MKLNKDAKLRTIKPNHMLTNIYSVNDIKSMHRSHFFSPDTMRFFKSRLIQNVFPTNKGSVYFVTSESAGFRDTTRVFNVRSYMIKYDYMETIVTLSSRTTALSTALNLAYELTLKEEVLND